MLSEFHRRHRLATVLVLFAMSTLLSACGGGDSSGGTPTPAIRFAAPPGTSLTAHPGETLNVDLVVNDPAAFTHGVAVIGSDRLGTSKVLKTPPFSFLLALPADLAPGTYTLTAAGYGDGDTGQPLSSARARLRVSLPDDALLSLAPPPATLLFEAVGEQLPVRMVGTTADGPVVLNDSPAAGFSTLDPGVASVDRHGLVTAVAPGTTKVALLRRNQTVGHVPIRVLHPALIPSETTLAFGKQAAGSEGAGQSLQLTNHWSYPIRIQGIDSPPAFPESDDCLSASPLAPGQACLITLTFRPEAPGKIEGVLRITTSAVTAQTRIYLSGTGS